MPPKLFVKNGIFPSPEVRASFFKNTNQDRSESCIAVNPSDNNNLIGASKLFTDPKKYKFVVATVFSVDGGSTWQDSAPLQMLPGWEGFSDPAIAFDKGGTAYLFTEPLNFNYPNDPDHNPNIASDIVSTHMVIFKSTNKGASWSAPIVVDANDNNADSFDKLWLAIDQSNGAVYTTWGFGNMQFARSVNGGASWKGVGNQPINNSISSGSAPEINVGSNGFIHIVSHSTGSNNIRYLRSKNGGDSFEPEKQIAVGLKDIDAGITGSGFKTYPNASFRVLTLATACSVPNQTRVAVAWADYRENVTRIYYTFSNDNGDTWPANSGIPLLPAFSTGERFHDFHPQIVAAGNGVIGCAFYRYYEASALIDVMFTVSFDGGQSFWFPEKLNSHPWNPAINAPWSHGNSSRTFIGDYFGLDADAENFHVLWTNTKDGVQELYYNMVRTSKFDPPHIFDGIAGRIFGGVAVDGGGYIFVNGKLIRVPPRSPLLDVLHAIAAYDSVENLTSVSGRRLQKAMLETISNIAKKANKQIG
ncbi:MAG: exo-alpha-sialidase [Flavisolibacter sp.]|nr:exo-alpha-sialidase [Flavisolibacter sp.]